jgi:hypothetical protein
LGRAGVLCFTLGPAGINGGTEPDEGVEQGFAVGRSGTEVVDALE